MDLIKNYRYPIIIIFLLLIIGWVLLAFVYGGDEVEDAMGKKEMLDDYVSRIEAIEGLSLSADFLETDLYLSLTDEFEKEVTEVDIGRVNPFSPF
ncbi:MAG: hypothetical protein ACLFNN_02635 [Candidatus Paceibacterota bacterium]